MSENVGDLFDGRAALNHPNRGGVTKSMCSRPGRWQSGTLVGSSYCTSDHISADGLPHRRSMSEKKMPVSTARSPVSQIGHDGVPNGGGKGKKVDLPALRNVYGQRAITPVNVIEGQRCDVTNPKAKPAHDEEHGVVTAPRRAGPIGRAQETLFLIFGQVLRKSRFAPTCYSRNGMDEWLDGVSTEDKISEIASERGRYHSDRTRAASAGAIQEKVPKVLGAQVLRNDRGGVEPPDEEISDIPSTGGPRVLAKRLRMIRERSNIRTSHSGTTGHLS